MRENIKRTAMRNNTRRRIVNDLFDIEDTIFNPEIVIIFIEIRLL